MPRYFFDVRNGGELASDEEGMILPTVEAWNRKRSMRLATWRGTH